MQFSAGTLELVFNTFITKMLIKWSKIIVWSNYLFSRTINLSFYIICCTQKWMTVFQCKLITYFNNITLSKLYDILHICLNIIFGSKHTIPQYGFDGFVIWNWQLWKNPVLFNWFFGRTCCKIVLKIFISFISYIINVTRVG